MSYIFLEIIKGTCAPDSNLAQHKNELLGKITCGPVQVTFFVCYFQKDTGCLTGMSGLDGVARANLISHIHAI
jgi:hypothetical protein